MDSRSRLRRTVEDVVRIREQTNERLGRARGASTPRWFASLVLKLDSIPEGDGTMLDDTICVWAHEQSVGGTYQRTDMPYVVAGNAVGTFKTGRAIDFQGASCAKLLSALATAVGVPTRPSATHHSTRRKPALAGWIH